MEYTANYVKSTQAMAPDRLIQPDLLYDGDRYRGPDQVGKLCRRLKTGRLKIYTIGGTLSMTFDVEKRAKLSLRESKSGIGGMRYVKFVPFDASKRSYSRSSSKKVQSHTGEVK